MCAWYTILHVTWVQYRLCEVQCKWTIVSNWFCVYTDNAYLRMSHWCGQWHKHRTSYFYWQKTFGTNEQQAVFKDKIAEFNYRWVHLVHWLNLEMGEWFCCTRQTMHFTMLLRYFNSRYFDAIEKLPHVWEWF